MIVHVFRDYNLAIFQFLLFYSFDLYNIRLTVISLFSLYTILCFIKILVNSTYPISFKYF